MKTRRRRRGGRWAWRFKWAKPSTKVKFVVQLSDVFTIQKRKIRVQAFCHRSGDSGCCGVLLERGLGHFGSLSFPRKPYVELFVVALARAIYSVVGWQRNFRTPALIWNVEVSSSTPLGLVGGFENGPQIRWLVQINCTTAWAIMQVFFLAHWTPAITGLNLPNCLFKCTHFVPRF